MAQKMEVRYIRYYSDGSAAHKLEPKLPFKKIARKPKAKKQKQIVVPIDPLAIVGIVLAVVMLVLMIVGSVQLKAAQQQQAQMESYLQTLTQDHADLQMEYANGYDLAEVEEYAIALGMIPVEQAEHISLSGGEMELQAQP